MHAGRAGTRGSVMRYQALWYVQRPKTSLCADGRAKGGTWSVKLLYDSLCPICMREIRMLSRRNQAQKLAFVDIADLTYDPNENAGIDFHTAMGTIHAIRRDGTVLTGIEAFRASYEAVGLGWVYAITRIRPIGLIAEVIYSIWARHRLWITGRPPIVESSLEEGKRKRCK